MKLKVASSLLGVTAFCLLASVSVAQTSGPVASKGATVHASPINTDRFLPRIDTTFVSHLIEPENPMGLPPQGPPNNLVAGESTKVPKGKVGASFPAIDATGWTPPDCTLAVGPSHVVATVNSSLAFFTKTGTKQLQQTFNTFFTGMPQTTFIFDPKCFYDRIRQRFVVVVLEKSGTNNSKLLFAVSDDSDPNGTWYRYRFDCRLTLNGNEYWLDYPGFGYNKDVYVVSGNMFPFSNGGFGGVQFQVIPSALATTGAAITPTVLQDENSGNVQLAEMIDPTSDKIYGVTAWNSARLAIYALRDLTTAPAWDRTLLTIPSFSYPSRDANSTNGRTLDSMDGRIYNASWRNGKLVCAHNTISGNLAVRWYEVNTGTWPTSGSPTLSQSGNITGAEDFHMPGISQNAWGDIGIMYSRSSTNITADLVYSARSAGDAAGTISAPTLLESSVGNEYTQSRWGDYFKVDVDPVDDSTFWGIGMTIDGSNNWRTSIYSFSLAVPVSGWVRQNSVGVAGTTVQFLDGGGNVVASAVTNGSGDYTANVSPGTWTVKPIHNDKYFFPSTRTVTVPPTATAQNFTAANIGPHSIVFEFPVVYSDQSRRGTLGLNVETPVARTVTMSDNSFKLTSPVSVTVAAGQRLKEFFVYGVSVTADTLVTVTASHQGVTATGQITVRQKPALTGFTLADTVKGGRGVSGSVAIDKPAIGAMFLQLSSSNPAIATITPGNTAMPNGASSKAFYIKSFPVATTQNVTITAQFYGSTATKNLQVTP